MDILPTSSASLSSEISHQTASCRWKTDCPLCCQQTHTLCSRTYSAASSAPRRPLRLRSDLSGHIERSTPSDNKINDACPTCRTTPSTAAPKIPKRLCSDLSGHMDDDTTEPSSEGSNHDVSPTRESPPNHTAHQEHEDSSPRLPRRSWTADAIVPLIDNIDYEQSSAVHMNSTDACASDSIVLPLSSLLKHAPTSRASPTPRAA